MTNPVSLRRANSSRNADSRAVSATPLSGSSNVWKWASNIGRVSWAGIVGSSGKFRNASQILSIWQKLCLNCCTCVDGMGRLLLQAVHPTISGGTPEVFQLNDEGTHDACLYV